MTDLAARSNRSAGKGLALIRIIVGCWFAKALFTKLALAGGFFPFRLRPDRWIETMPKIIAKQMAENPTRSYKAFVEGTVLPNVPLFANLTASVRRWPERSWFSGCSRAWAPDGTPARAQLRHGQLAHVAGQPGISLDLVCGADRILWGARRHDLGARRGAGQAEAWMVGQQATLELNVQYGPRLMWLGPPAPAISQKASVSE